MLAALNVYCKRAWSSGFIYVFVANFFSYLVAFCGSIAYARLMGKYEFGLYSFAFNIVSFFLLVNGFGCASGILQFVSRTADAKLHLAYFRYAVIMGWIFNGGLSLLIMAYALFVPLPIPGVKNILLLMSFFPIGRLYLDVLQAYLRATEQNMLLAKVAITLNGILLLLQILGLLLYSLLGFIVVTYVAYALIMLIAIYVYKSPNIWVLTKAVLPSINAMEFMRYSLYATVGNAFAQLLFVLDILFLGYILHEANVVAVYRVVTIIPFALAFIPGVVMTFFYPQFARNAGNLDYVRRLRLKVMRGMLYFSGSISLVLILIAQPFIGFIFGAEYLSGVLPFQILAFGFWISATFRIVNGNILSCLGHARFNMLVNCGVMLVNCILTFILIWNWGIIGAAIGVVIIYILSALISSYALNSILR